jgi:ankyrin repeat protein
MSLEYSLICDAVERKNVDELKRLIGRWYPKDDMDYLLFYAVTIGDIEIVKILLENDADVNSESFDGVPCIIQACFDGDLDMIMFLLDHGADIDDRDCDGYVPLSASCELQDLDAVELLLKKGAKVNIGVYNMRSPLVLALNESDTCIVKLLLENGADPNLKCYRSKYTPIMKAVEIGSLENAKLLIKYGANIFESRVLFKCDRNNLELDMMELLIHGGANVNVVEFNTHILEIMKQHPGVLKLLVDHGAIIQDKQKMDEIRSLLPRWTRSNHNIFHKTFRNGVKAVLMLSNNRDCNLARLPKDVLYYLFKFL